jgi:hypothetical protein
MRPFIEEVVTPCAKDMEKLNATAKRAKMSRDVMSLIGNVFGD